LSRIVQLFLYNIKVKLTTITMEKNTSAFDTSFIIDFSEGFCREIL